MNWTPVSTLGLTFPALDGFVACPRSLIVLIVYHHFGSLSTKKIPKKPVDFLSVDAILYIQLKNKERI